MEQLIFTEGKRATTASGQVGIVMLIYPQQDEDCQFFQYVLQPFGDPVRIEWDKDTMSVVLPPTSADPLIKNGWARAMTHSEVRAYNRGLNSEREKEISQ